MHVQAEDISRSLNGRRARRGWMARCPAHDDRNPSLSIRQVDGIVLVHCFSGCSQRAVIAVLAHRGLWPSGNRRKEQHKIAVSPSAAADYKAQARTGEALRRWRETGPLSDLAKRYFQQHRKLDVAGLYLDHAVRWHEHYKVVISLMTDPVTNEPTGIHRTFLDVDGAKLNRKMLGRQGVVRLSPDDAVSAGLGIAEGIEDALAVMLSGWRPVWAATSADGIAKLPVLAGIQALTIFADADAAGLQAAENCRDRWRAAGREVVIAAPGAAI